LAVGLYPLKFKPIYKKRIWGGRKLKEFFDKDIPPSVKIGESWELADLPNDKSVITNGRLAGQSLGAAVAKYPQEITGDENFKGPFPLLIKFLDAEDILSVQVHPDAAACERIGSGEPKTECWYIIAAESDAVIYKGLKKGVTKEKFAAAIKKGGVADMLAKVAVKAGQCHFLPAGTVHSIGAGLLIAEIQMPSDTTYRVFDWNRVDESGKARPLHIEEALESINFDAAGKKLAVTTTGRLADCEYFKIDKGRQAKNSRLFLAQDKMECLIVLSGFGIISRSDKDSVEFRKGDCLLIPAAYEGTMQFAADSEYLTITI
jgi:mannose-6-phosphate isomerase